MPMPMPGQLPPTMAPAAANAGPIAVPQGNQGNAVHAMSMVRNAVEILQKALPMIPMGSPLHADILNATSKIAKHMEQNQENKGVDMQSMLQMIRQASQQSPMQALNKLHPPAPNTPPAMPAPPASPPAE